MFRALLTLSAVATLASAFWLYQLSFDTRRLESHVTAEERAVERLRQDIAVLEAERAYLSRPARIEPFARMMGLRPATPDQFAPAHAPPAGRQ